MSFVDRFYTFLIDLSAIERSIFEKVRLKVPKYPTEELIDLVIRVMVYTHNWSPALEFSANPQNTDHATLCEKDHSGDYSRWITTGIPDLKVLRLAVRRYPKCIFAVYFYHREQIERFCHLLRGTKENWVEPVHFYLIPPESVIPIVEGLQSSNQWSVTESDQIFFMEIAEQQFEVPLLAIDIWREYQASLLAS